MQATEATAYTTAQMLHFEAYSKTTRYALKHKTWYLLGNPKRVTCSKHAKLAKTANSTKLLAYFYAFHTYFSHFTAKIYPEPPKAVISAVFRKFVV